MAKGDVVLENQNAQVQIDEYVNSFNYSGNPEIADIQRAYVQGGIKDLANKNPGQPLKFDEKTKRTLDRTFKNISGDDNSKIKWIQSIPLEYRNGIIEDLKNNGISKIESIDSLFSSNRQRKVAIQDIDKYINAAFGTKVDRSLFRFDYEGELGDNLRKAHEVADTIEIEENNLFSAQDIQNVTLSCFLRDEWMKEFGIKNKDCPPELQEEDLLENGTMVLYENFITGDSRENVQVLRVNLPKARNLSKKLIADFTSGENKKELADVMKHGFDSMLSNNKALKVLTERKCIFTKKHLVEIYDKLNEEEFKDLVTFTDEEKKFVEVSRKELELLNRYGKVHEEITEELENYNFYNKEPRIENGKIVNLELDEKFTELYAIEKYFDAKERYLSELLEVRTAQTDMYVSNSMVKKRNIAEFEEIFLENTDKFIEVQKNDIITNKDKLVFPSNSENYKKLLINFQSFGSAATTLLKGQKYPADDFMYREHFNVKIRKDFAQSYNEAKTMQNPKEAMDYLEKLSKMEELKPNTTYEELNERLDFLREAGEYFDNLDVSIKSLYIDPDDPEYREENHIEGNISAYISAGIKVIENGLKTDNIIRDIKAEETNKEIEEALKDEYIDVKKAVDENAIKEAERKLEERSLFGRLTKDGAKEFLKEDLEEFKNLCNELDDPVLTNLCNNIDKAVKSEDLEDLSEQLLAGANGYRDILNEKMLSSDDPKTIKALNGLNKITNSLSAYEEAGSINGANKKEVEEKYSYAFTYAERRIDEISKDIKNIEARFKNNPEGLNKDKSYQIANKALDCMEHIKECIIGDAFCDPKNNMETLTNSNDLLIVGMHELCKGENSKLVDKVDNKFLKKLANEPYVVKNRKELNIDKLEKNLMRRERAIDFINDPNKGKVKNNSAKDKNKNLEIDQNVRGLN